MTAEGSGFLATGPGEAARDRDRSLCCRDAAVRRGQVGMGLGPPRLDSRQNPG
jgi:hypothetical protein